MIKPYEDYITTSEEEEEEEEGVRSRRKDDEHNQRWDLPKSQSSSWYNNDRTPPSPTVEEEKEGSDDSDQEFLVHPCLRSLIKSKSAYAFAEEAPKMKTSKTTFEMSLSKMYVSTTQSLMADAEPPVALFGLNFDTKWPEPESPKKARKDRKSPSLSKVSGCWSSPPNVYLDDSVMPSSPDSAHGECWSAPECLNDDDRSSISSEEEREPLGQGPYSDSYPVIDTPENDPSICSIPLPSSSSTSASSPSPPRPLSPVLGRPAPKQERMSGSRSMQLRPRPSPNAFCSSDAPPGSSDDEWPQKEPWPQQEVWPEPEVLQRRQLSGWDEATPLPRSVSVQFNNSHRVQVPASRSAHSNLNGFIDPIDQSSLQGSAHSQLDEGERTEVSSRQAWMERGSMAQLRIQAAHTIHEDLVYYGHGRNGMVESRNSMGGSAHYLHYDDEGTSEGMRRSYTTQEFRKGRRRLPRRPDAPPFRGELPSSISLYDRSLRDYYGRTYEFSTEERLDIQSMRQSTEIQSVPRQTSQPPIPHERRPPSLHLDAHMDSSKSTRHSMSRADGPYAELETPMSPPFNVLPSPLSTGRRLPALPLHSSILSRLPPMSVPPPPPQKNQDHTLCFMDGMSDSVMGRSTFEDSYYEDDTINGNRYRRQRKSFFSPDDSSGVSSCTTSDSLNPTHRVQSAFHPRHSDEVLLEIGDAVHVERASDDHWSYGTNLRTGLAGIFPSAVVCEIDLVEEICLGALPTATKGLSDERDTFYLTMLASIEVAHHKGNDILIQAMNKVLAMYKNHEEVIVPQTVLMEISFRGIHVIDKRKKNFFQCPTFDFFYSLQNISFCGAHPKQLKYFGYITKHPLLPKFACHVFMSNQSTQPIVESIGRAFKRSYDEYMAFAHPTEDIYLE